MIRSVRIRGFKRLHEAKFHFTGNVVPTGPNETNKTNKTNKTTVLQAIAPRVRTLRRWRDLGDFKRATATAGRRARSIAA